MAKNVVEVDGDYYFFDDKTCKIQQLVFKDVPSLPMDKVAKILKAVLEIKSAKPAKNGKSGR